MILFDIIEDFTKMLAEGEASTDVGLVDQIINHNSLFNTNFSDDCL
jgi:hypothetical protein